MSSERKKRKHPINEWEFMVICPECHANFPHPAKVNGFPHMEVFMKTSDYWGSSYIMLDGIDRIYNTEADPHTMVVSVRMFLARTSLPNTERWLVTVSGNDDTSMCRSFDSSQEALSSFFHVLSKGIITMDYLNSIGFEH